MDRPLDQEMSVDRFCELPSGIRLCFRVHGPSDGEPLLLIAGLGLQLIYWSPRLLQALVERGFRVIVFDNRDVGRSTMVDRPAPGLFRKLLARPDATGYRLEDMAEDAAGLLDHLAIGRAHVLGMSMGGMIGQCLAAAHPHRVASLFSLFSTTGARNVGQPAGSTLWRLARQRPAHSLERSVANYLDIMAHIGPTRYAMPEDGLRAYAVEAWQRGAGAVAADGESRQIGAIINSGDRTAQLRRIQAPTLVVHGDVDLMVAVSGGAATAAAIPGAAFATLPGLGHFVPDEALPQLLELIEGHSRASVPSSSETASTAR